MTWQETHIRLQLLREVEDTIARRDDGRLPWREGYAEVFGDVTGLRAQLAYRIRLARQAQLDPNLAQEDLEEAHREMAARHRAVLRVLRNAPAVAAPGTDRADALCVPA